MNSSLFGVDTVLDGVVVSSSVTGHVRLKLRVLLKLVKQVVLTPLIKFYLFWR